jgi:molecular chaperone GrpE (heat shock protein)
MSELEVLKARVARLETELSNQRRVFIKEVRKMIDFHTHTLGGKVVWEFPPEVMKKGLEKMADMVRKNRQQSGAEENIPVSDKFDFTLTKVDEKIV